jgi:hypothetical protein
LEGDELQFGEDEQVAVEEDKRLKFEEDGLFEEEERLKGFCGNLNESIILVKMNSYFSHFLEE